MITVATRLAAGLERVGGFEQAAMPLPPGRWTDVFTGRTLEPNNAGSVLLADLLTPLPVALLVAS